MHIQKHRAWLITISFLFILFFRYLPAPEGLGPSAMQVIGTFIGVLILWMTISIDWPSLLAIAAIAFVPEMNINQILSSSIGSSTFAFLMFTFMCTYTLGQTTFIRRMALAFLDTKLASHSYWSFMVLYFLSVLFLGAFISPTVLVVILIPLSEQIFEILGLSKGSKTANMMMMGMVFTSGIAAGMTPIAHVFPLMALSFFQNATGQAISYLSYLLTGIPVALLTILSMLLLFRWVLNPNKEEIQNRDISHLKQALPPLSKREKYIIAIFFMVVSLWILPDLIKPIFPNIATFISHYGTAMPPLLGVVLMSIITTDGQPLLDFKKAMSNGIPWASLIMVAGTLTIASALTNEAIGITNWISAQMTPLTQSLSPLALIFLFLLWASVQTNLSSNMVTVTVVTSIALPLTTPMASIHTAALTALVGMMASYAFATPPAMATIVFAIGSGWTNTKDMAKYGLILMLCATLIATFVGYPIASYLM